MHPNDHVNMGQSTNDTFPTAMHIAAREILDDARDSLVADAEHLYRLAAGGTAVRTGLNTTPGFAEEIAAETAQLTGRPFVTAPNKFAAQASLDPLVRCSAGLRNVAVSLFKVTNDATIAMAGKEGNFELNTFRPVIIANLVHSMRILADMSHNLRRYMIDGIELEEARLRENVDRSVMMVTALAPVIGDDEASKIAHAAIDEDLTLRAAGSSTV